MNKYLYTCRLLNMRAKNKSNAHIRWLISEELLRSPEAMLSKVKPKMV